MIVLTEDHEFQFPPVDSEALLHAPIVEVLHGELVHTVTSTQTFLRSYITQHVLLLVIVLAHLALEALSRLLR